MAEELASDISSLSFSAVSIFARIRLKNGIVRITKKISRKPKKNERAGKDKSVGTVASKKFCILNDTIGPNIKPREPIPVNADIVVAVNPGLDILLASIIDGTNITPAPIPHNNKNVKSCQKFPVVPESPRKIPYIADPIKTKGKTPVLRDNTAEG